MRKIILAIDSFKGCISSSAIARLITEYGRQQYPDMLFLTIPIADGGEGVTEVMAQKSCSTVRLTVHDPLMRPMEGSYLLADNGDTAIIEMATAAGLPLVEPTRRNPLFTTTYGVGEMIADALERGCRKLLMGIGGSATNDAGTGMLQALGFRFMDCNGNELFGSGENLEKITFIDTQHTHPLLTQAQFEVACDVRNPFYGKEGAAYVFAPQKGADDQVVAQLDRGLKHFANVIHGLNGCRVDTIPGAGAAGGMGGGLIAFLNARLCSGIDMILDYMEFDRLIEGASLIITGEGKMDRQTLMGKAPYGVLQRALQRTIPVIALAGRIEDQRQLLEAGFSHLFEVSPRDIPLSEAMKQSTVIQNIERIVKSADFAKFLTFR